jgi:hypothetical protein
MILQGGLLGFRGVKMTLQGDTIVIRMSLIKSLLTSHDFFENKKGYFGDGISFPP